MKQFDKAFIEELIAAARQKSLTGVKIKLDEKSIEIELGVQHVVVEKAATEPLKKDEKENWVKSSLVGFFRMPKKPFSPGDEVKKDSVIGILEALGLPNEIVAGYDGVFDSLVVSEGQAIEFGQKIARIKP